MILCGRYFLSNKPHVFIDIDNTIVDFANTFYNMYKYYNIPVVNSWLSDTYYRNISHNVEDLVNKAVLYINYNSRPFDGVIEFTHRLNKLSVMVYFITRRNTKKEIVYSTYYFMRKFDIYFDKIIFCKNKVDYVNNNTILFIEDSNDVLIDLISSGKIQREKIYKVTWNWNKNIKVDEINFLDFNVEEKIKKFLIYD